MTDVTQTRMVDLREKQKGLAKTLQLYDIAITQQEKKLDATRRGKYKFAQISDEVLYALILGDLKRLQKNRTDIKDEIDSLEKAIQHRLEQRAEEEKDRQEQAEDKNDESTSESKNDEEDKDKNKGTEQEPISVEKERESFGEVSTTQTPTLSDTHGLGRDVNPEEFSIEEDQLVF